MVHDQQKSTNNCLVRTITVVLFFSMMAFASTGFAEGTLKKERSRSHIELDPNNTGTYTGQAGKDNFTANCSPCHGESGKGDGPLADTIGEGVKPSNLSDARLLSSRTEEFLFKVVKSGGVSVGLSESMPSWKETFTDAQIKQIVQYIRNGICKCEYRVKK